MKATTIKNLISTDLPGYNKDISHRQLRCGTCGNPMQIGTISLMGGGSLWLQFYCYDHTGKMMDTETHPTRVIVLENKVNANIDFFTNDSNQVKSLVTFNGSKIVPKRTSEDGKVCYWELQEIKNKVE